jgi:predicted RNase H-like HicB family nuclease
MKTNPLEDLKALAYPVRVEYDDEDAVFVADFLDLPGCSATGATVAEAYDNALAAKAEWLRVTLEQGLPVPKPSKARDFSGRILVRLPVSLHASLSDRARVNGASLNQYIVHLLSAGAAGDQVSSKLEAVTEHLRAIQSWMVAGSTTHPSGMFLQGTDQSERLGWQKPKYQGVAPLPTASSAFESACTI